MSVNARMKQARIAAGLSIGQAARLLNCRQYVLALREDEWFAIEQEIAFARQAADVYGVSENWLLTGEPDDPAAVEEVRKLCAKMPAESVSKIIEIVEMIRTEK